MTISVVDFSVEGSSVVVDGLDVEVVVRSVVVSGEAVGGSLVTTGVGFTTTGVEVEATTAIVVVALITIVGVADMRGVPDITVVATPGIGIVAVGVATGVAPGKICRLTRV